MEKVLDVYQRPYDERFPVVCMDESSRQLLAEVRTPVSLAPKRPARYDYEYQRQGVGNVFLASEPLAGKRRVKITERKTKQDGAWFLFEIARSYPKAEKITLVMDNLNTHKPGSLYETFPPQEAKELWGRFEFVYPPKHGSWLNLAEIELNVLTRQCLNRRLPSLEAVTAEVEAWQRHRNNQNAVVNWQFTTADARVKLKRLYPTLHI